MAKSSVVDLKAQIAAGKYAIDSTELAGDIASKFALVRRVRRELMSDDEPPATGEPGRSARSRGPRGARPAGTPRQARGKRP